MGSGGLCGTQVSAASHALLFLTVGGAHGRAGFLVVASGRGRLEAGDVIRALVKFCRRLVDLHEGGFFFRQQDALALELAADVASDT